MSALYRCNDAELIAKLLTGAGAHLQPVDLLDGLSPEQANTRPEGLPHSIAEIVAHLCFWQEWFNTCLLQGYPGLPAEPAIGWPAPGNWEELRARFLAALAEGERLALASQTLGEALVGADISIPFLVRESLGSWMLHAVLHNSHHLGQVVTIRQLLNAWPPPCGPLAW
jgi:uncharacterized damage-inducible protein DinB